MTYRSRQEIFDIAYLGLEEQGLEEQGFVASRVSPHKSAKCLYRGPDGLKCAIGHLISDQDYKKSFENQTPEYSKNVCKAAKINPLDKDFGALLQECHDLSADPQDMKSKLITFAQEYGLKVPG